MMTSKPQILVKQIDDRDREEVLSWFTQRKWPFPPTGGTLPADTGYVAFRGNEYLACCWLYLTNSDIVLKEWVATNPQIEATGTRLKGLKVLDDYVKKLIVGQGFRTVIHFTSNRGLSKYYKTRLGYKLARKQEDCVVWTAPAKSGSRK